MGAGSWRWRGACRRSTWPGAWTSWKRWKQQRSWKDAVAGAGGRRQLRAARRTIPSTASGAHNCHLPRRRETIPLGQWALRRTAVRRPPTGRPSGAWAPSLAEAMMGMFSESGPLSHMHSLSEHVAAVRQALGNIAGPGRLPAHLLFSDRDFDENDYEALLVLDETVTSRKGESNGHRTSTLALWCGRNVKQSAGLQEPAKSRLSVSRRWWWVPGAQGQRRSAAARSAWRTWSPAPSCARWRASTSSTAIAWTGGCPTGQCAPSASRL